MEKNKEHYNLEDLAVDFSYVNLASDDYFQRTPIWTLVVSQLGSPFAIVGFTDEHLENVVIKYNEWLEEEYEGE